MHWFFEALTRTAQQLRRWEVLLFLGTLAAFLLLAVLVAVFAFQTDSLLRYLHLTMLSCRELTNGPIIFLFCGMVFFTLAALVTFGDLQRHFEAKAHRAFREANRAMKQAIISGGIALAIAVGALVFFRMNCL